MARGVWARQSPPMASTSPRGGVAEEVVLLFAADLADELDLGPLQQRLDLVLVVVPVAADVGVLLVRQWHARRDTQGQAGPLRDANGDVEALVGRDAAQERQ